MNIKKTNNLMNIGKTSREQSNGLGNRSSSDSGKKIGYNNVQFNDTVQFQKIQLSQKGCLNSQKNNNRQKQFINPHKNQYQQQQQRQLFQQYSEEPLHMVTENQHYHHNFNSINQGKLTSLSPEEKGKVGKLMLALQNEREEKLLLKQKLQETSQLLQDSIQNFKEVNTTIINESRQYQQKYNNSLQIIQGYQQIADTTHESIDRAAYLQHLANIQNENDSIGLYQKRKMHKKQKTQQDLIVQKPGTDEHSIYVYQSLADEILQNKLKQQQLMDQPKPTNVNEKQLNQQKNPKKDIAIKKSGEKKQINKKVNVDTLKLNKNGGNKANSKLKATSLTQTMNNNINNKDQNLELNQQDDGVQGEHHKLINKYQSNEGGSEAQIQSIQVQNNRQKVLVEIKSLKQELQDLTQSFSTDFTFLIENKSLSQLKQQQKNSTSQYCTADSSNFNSSKKFVSFAKNYELQKKASTGNEDKSTNNNLGRRSFGSQAGLHQNANNSSIGFYDSLTQVHANSISVRDNTQYIGQPSIINNKNSNYDKSTVSIHGIASGQYLTNQSCENDDSNTNDCSSDEEELEIAKRWLQIKQKKIDKLKDFKEGTTTHTINNSNNYQERNNSGQQISKQQQQKNVQKKNIQISPKSNYQQKAEGEINLPISINNHSKKSILKNHQVPIVQASKQQGFNRHEGLGRQIIEEEGFLQGENQITNNRNQNNQAFIHQNNNDYKQKQYQQRIDQNLDDPEKFLQADVISADRERESAAVQYNNKFSPTPKANNQKEGSDQSSLKMSISICKSINSNTFDISQTQIMNSGQKTTQSFQPQNTGPLNNNDYLDKFIRNAQECNNIVQQYHQKQSQNRKLLSNNQSNFEQQKQLNIENQNFLNSNQSQIQDYATFRPDTNNSTSQEQGQIETVKVTENYSLLSTPEPQQFIVRQVQDGQQKVDQKNFLTVVNSGLEKEEGEGIFNNNNQINKQPHSSDQQIQQLVTLQLQQQLNDVQQLQQDKVKKQQPTINKQEFDAETIQEIFKEIQNKSSQSQSNDQELREALKINEFEINENLNNKNQPENISNLYTNKVEGYPNNSQILNNNTKQISRQQQKQKNQHSQTSTKLGNQKQCEAYDPNNKKILPLIEEQDFYEEDFFKIVDSIEKEQCQKIKQNQTESYSYQQQQQNYQNKQYQNQFQQQQLNLKAQLEPQQSPKQQQNRQQANEEDEDAQIKYYNPGIIQKENRIIQGEKELQDEENMDESDQQNLESEGEISSSLEEQEYVDEIQNIKNSNVDELPKQMMNSLSSNTETDISVKYIKEKLEEAYEII